MIRSPFLLALSLLLALTTGYSQQHKSDTVSLREVESLFDTNPPLTHLLNDTFKLFSIAWSTRINNQDRAPLFGFFGGPYFLRAQARTGDSNWDYVIVIHTDQQFYVGNALSTSEDATRMKEEFTSFEILPFKTEVLRDQTMSLVRYTLAPAMIERFRIEPGSTKDKEAMRDLERRFTDPKPRQINIGVERNRHYVELEASSKTLTDIEKAISNLWFTSTWPDTSTKAGKPLGQ